MRCGTPGMAQGGNRRVPGGHQIPQTASPLATPPCLPAMPDFLRICDSRAAETEPRGGRRPRLPGDRSDRRTPASPEVTRQPPYGPGDVPVTHDHGHHPRRVSPRSPGVSGAGSSDSTCLTNAGAESRTASIRSRRPVISVKPSPVSPHPRSQAGAGGLAGSHYNRETPEAKRHRSAARSAEPPGEPETYVSFKFYSTRPRSTRTIHQLNFFDGTVGMLASAIGVTWQSEWA